MIKPDRSSARKGRRAKGADHLGPGRAFAVVIADRHFKAAKAFLTKAIGVRRDVVTGLRTSLQKCGVQRAEVLLRLGADQTAVAAEFIRRAVAANNVNDVVRSDTDLAIFHSRTPPDGWTCEILFEKIIGPVASQQYLDQVLGSDDAPITLLEYRHESPNWVNWETLLPAGAEDWFSRTTIRQCTSYIQSINLAMEGAGIGLGVLPMLRRELADDRLVQLEKHELATGRRYYLAVPEGKAVSHSTREFMEFVAGIGRG